MNVGVNAFVFASNDGALWDEAKKAARKAKRSKRPIGKTDKPAKRVRTGQKSAVTLWSFC